jgi:hypothetical protein
MPRTGPALIRLRKLWLASAYSFTSCAIPSSLSARSSLAARPGRVRSPAPKLATIGQAAAGLYRDHGGGRRPAGGEAGGARLDRRGGGGAWSARRDGRAGARSGRARRGAFAGVACIAPPPGRTLAAPCGAVRGREGARADRTGLQEPRGRGQRAPGAGGRRETFARLGAATDLARIEGSSGLAGPAHELTRRELEVLRLLSAGETNKGGDRRQAGRQRQAVDRRVSNIYAKLGVSAGRRHQLRAPARAHPTGDWVRSPTRRGRGFGYFIRCTPRRGAVASGLP